MATELENLRKEFKRQTGMEASDADSDEYIHWLEGCLIAATNHVAYLYDRRRKDKDDPNS
jgi:hypothetical protein